MLLVLGKGMLQASQNESCSRETDVRSDFSFRTSWPGGISSFAKTPSCLTYCVSALEDDCSLQPVLSNLSMGPRKDVEMTAVKLGSYLSRGSSTTLISSFGEMHIISLLRNVRTSCENLSGS